MSEWCFRWFLFVVVLAAGSSVSLAQGGVSYTINSITPLSFGNVVPGSTVSIHPSSPQAALVSITRSSAGNATSSFNITLPVAFNHAGQSIPITINNGDIQLIANNGSPTSPASLPSFSFNLGGGQPKTLQVRIGGSVTIPLDATPGIYNGMFNISITNTSL